eukprot:336866_1
MSERRCCYRGWIGIIGWLMLIQFLHQSFLHCHWYLYRSNGNVAAYNNGKHRVFAGHCDNQRSDSGLHQMVFIKWYTYCVVYAVSPCYRT